MGCRYESDDESAAFVVTCDVNGCIISPAAPSTGPAGDYDPHTASRGAYAIRGAAPPALRVSRCEGGAEDGGRRARRRMGGGGRKGCVPGKTWPGNVRQCWRAPGECWPLGLTARCAWRDAGLSSPVLPNQGGRRSQQAAAAAAPTKFEYHEGGGWKIGHDAEAESDATYSAMVGSDDFSIALTRPEFVDFVQVCRRRQVVCHFTERI